MRDNHPNLHQLQPLLRVGKSGITDGIVQHFKTVLQRKKVVKVKFLKSSFEDSSIDHIAKQLADRCNAHVMQRVGFVVTYGRRN